MISAESVSQPPDWQPNDYQRTLLTRLGEADPAEVQARTPMELRALAAAAGADLRTRPAAGEWSVLGCIAHICDAELVIAGRYRWILAHDEPDILPYDQDRWVDRLHADPDETADDLLAWFEPLRRADVALWRATAATDLTRFGIHRERGRESYGLTFKLTAGHDLVHMDQARRTLEQVRAGR